MRNSLMPRFTLIACSLCTALLLLVNGCSSDPQSGISGSGAPVLVANGPISGFGSVIVNGVHFSTDSTDFYIDGQLARESDLRAGQLVTVSSGGNQTASTMAADSLHLNHSVQGTITSTDPILKTIEVLGQTVIVLPETSTPHVVGDSFSSLGIGQTVRVSGLRNGSKQIEASRLELVETSHGIVTGQISQLDPTTHSFSIGNQQVTYSADAQTAGLADNSLVQVFTSSQADAGPVVATSIRLIDDSGLPGDGQMLTTQGILNSLTNQNGNTLLQIAGYEAIVDANTVFLNGTQNDLLINSRLKLSGLISNSQLLLNKIEFIPRATNVASRTVGNLAVTQSSPVYQGYIQMTNDTIINTQANTRFVDHSELELRHFSLAHVRQGDVLVISFYINSAGASVATLIDRASTPDF